MFKDILLDLLAERGLNQRQFSKLTGIPPTTISGWIKADRLPDYNALIKLRLFFDVTADYLLGLEDETGAKTNNNYNNYGTHNGNVQF